MNSGANFSDCKKYRYSLWRLWDADKPLLGFIMLNPSTADETENDPTIERCQRRAEMMGYGGLIVTNLFAYRSTDPKGLKKVKDPAGFRNDRVIIEMTKLCGMTICGWGKHGNYLGRGQYILDFLRHLGIETHALKVNKDGSPSHPLYIGYDVAPKKF